MRRAGHSLHWLVVCMLLGCADAIDPGRDWVNTFTTREPVMDLQKKDPSALTDSTVMPYSSFYYFQIDCANPDVVDQTGITLPSLNYPVYGGSYVEPNTVQCSQIISPDYINKHITYNTRESPRDRFKVRTGDVSMRSLSPNLYANEMSTCCKQEKPCPECFEINSNPCSFMIIHPVSNFLLRKGRCNNLCRQVDCPYTCSDGTVNMI